MFIRCLLLSLALHGLLILRFHNVTKKASKEYLTTQNEVILRLNKIPAPVLKKKNKISKNKVETKKPLKRENTSLLSALKTKTHTSRINLPDKQSTETFSNYSQELKKFIESHKFYPKIARRLRHSGTVRIKMIISSEGHFQDIKLISPSKFTSLNNAALSLLTQLEKFKPLPPQLKTKNIFVIPIAYKLSNSI